jgi:hypothetical protein
VQKKCKWKCWPLPQLSFLCDPSWTTGHQRSRTLITYPEDAKWAKETMGLYVILIFFSRHYGLLYLVASTAYVQHMITTTVVVSCITPAQWRVVVARLGVSVSGRSTFKLQRSSWFNYIISACVLVLPIFRVVDGLVGPIGLQARRDFRCVMRRISMVLSALCLGGVRSIPDHFPSLDSLPLSNILTAL